MKEKVFETDKRALFEKLSKIARKGPIKASSSGPSAVGITLLSELGIAIDSQQKAAVHGIVVSARRGNRAHDPNRVNLLTKVPNWSISEIKSSRELLTKYGYYRDATLRLNCTVRAEHPNNQGLFLRVNRSRTLLNELYSSRNTSERVVCWKIDELRDRLIKSHPRSIWVTAQPSVREDVEYFHYRFATYSGAPDAGLFPDLVSQGTITVDHIISETGGGVTEKGPIFKIKPSNLPLLFPNNTKIDLMSYN